MSDTHDAPCAPAVLREIRRGDDQLRAAIAQHDSEQDKLEHRVRTLEVENARLRALIEGGTKTGRVIVSTGLAVMALLITLFGLYINHTK